MIWPLSTPLPFTLPCIVLSVCVSTGCCGGGDDCTSVALSLYITSIRLHLVGRTIQGWLKWVHARA